MNKYELMKVQRARRRAAWVVIAALGAAAAMASAAETGVMTISPAQLAADEVIAEQMSAAQLAMMADEQPAAEPAATQPAEEASTSWPPGLLQQGLNLIGLEKPMQSIGLRAYGYVETGFTGRVYGGPSRHQGIRNPPLFIRSFDGRNFNNLQLHQLKGTLERPIDTKKCFDLGGRLDFIYGADPRFTRSYGLMNDDVHANAPFRNDPNPFPFNHRELSDITQMYAEMWIGSGQEGKGLDVIFGKWVTPFGAEVIDAPSNYLYSRSILFQYAIPYAHTGVKATYNFNPTNNAYFAVVRGWDVFKDNNEGATWMTGMLWSGKDQCGSNPRSQLTLNFAAGPEQFSTPVISGHGSWHDNPGVRYLIDSTWTYRYTEKLTQLVNADFGYEEDVPTAVDNVGVVRKRDSDWYGVAYYLNYVFNDYVSTTGRAEWFRDHYGVRTGFQGDFFEVTTGVTLTPFPKDAILKNLTVRPELRWDWSAHNAPFAGEGNHDPLQMTAAIDVIYKF